jgi:uncharacterized protein involved in exopolysaccharide biosynthesis
MHFNEDYSMGSVFNALYKRRRFLLVFTIATVLVGLLAYALRPKKYTAETLFILKNPLYADRNNLYNNETKFIDYFASEADIDRMISMGGSDVIHQRLIQDMNLAEAYDYDTTDAKELVALKKKIASRLRLVRTENRDISLQYSDKDPKRAAAVANYLVPLLENGLRQFYNGMRMNMRTSIMTKIAEQDSTIDVLTDTLVKLRQQYGINDIISPSRHNIMLSSLKDNGNKDFARGVEVIQNIESVKDEVVSSRARNITLVNQYTTGTSMNELPLTNILKHALPPVKATGIGMVLVLVGSFLAGLFFGSLYILFSAFKGGN